MKESPVNTPNPDAPPVVDQGAPRQLLAACMNCMFFHANEQPDERKPKIGECRYDSPKADSRGGAQWVNTHGGLWCGKHPLLQAVLGEQVSDPPKGDVAIIRGLRLVKPDMSKETEEEENAD